MQPTNGNPQSPIEYPTVVIPGKGSFTVKFDLVAQYFLDKNLKMTAAEFGAALQEFLPKYQKDSEGKPVINEDGNAIVLGPGIIHPAFLFDVLSACLWKQLHMTGDQIAECFDTFDGLTDIVRAIGEAFVKTRWSSKVKLQETATNQAEPKPN